MPEHGETYASFAATHEVRLVRSVVSETGLPPAVAAQVVVDVLPAAYERRFATPGAAYGWLRVAARHRAAGSPTWADAADTALGCADSALTALACLPAADRELLRLRYVEGLRTEALAERLGVPAATVAERLDAIHAAAALALPAAAAPRPAGTVRPLVATRRHALPVSLPRLATAAAAVAAAVVATGSPAPTTTPPLADRPMAPYLAPSTTVSAGDELPLAASERPGRIVAVRATSVDTVVPLTPPHRDPAHPPGGSGGGGCQTDCNVRFFDEIHIRVPKDAAPAAGEEIVVRQDVATEHVRLCDVLEPLPREHAYCARANHQQ